MLKRTAKVNQQKFFFCSCYIPAFIDEFMLKKGKCVLKIILQRAVALKKLRPRHSRRNNGGV